jgi:quercetin dioxygenase-like cupin family protein
MMSHRGLLLAVGVAAFSAASVPAFGQALPLGVRSTEKFAGDVSLVAGGKTESVPVNLRVLALSPGAKIDDLRLGGQGVLLVELRIGRLTMEIGGDRQVRQPGDVFFVPADQKISAATIGDRSAVVATLLLPAH